MSGERGAFFLELLFFTIFTCWLTTEYPRAAFPLPAFDLNAQFSRPIFVTVSLLSFLFLLQDRNGNKPGLHLLRATKTCQRLKFEAEDLKFYYKRHFQVNELDHFINAQNMIKTAIKRDC